MSESKDLRDEAKKPKKFSDNIQPQGITVTIPCISYSSINYGATKIKLGAGGNGTVFLGHIEGEVSPVAIKEFIAEDFSEKTKRQIEREMKVMAQAAIGSLKRAEMQDHFFKKLRYKFPVNFC
jgi:hypothetical protein